MVRLYLIRHGKQDTDLCNVDVPLSDEGREQAGLAGRRLAQYPVDAVYSSNMLRAVETAQIINSYLHVPYQRIEDLREISFGELTGHSDAENREHFDFFFKKQAKMEWDLPYPGGESGEDVFKRAMPQIQKIARSGAKEIVVVTHGVLIRSLLCGIMGCTFAHRNMFGHHMENCSITELVYEEERDQFFLERFNDFSHLETHPELMRRNWKERL